MKEGDAAGLNTSSSERLVGEALWQLILVLKIVVGRKRGHNKVGIVA